MRSGTSRSSPPSSGRWRSPLQTCRCGSFTARARPSWRCPPRSGRARTVGGDRTAQPASPDRPRAGARLWRGGAVAAVRAGGGRAFRCRRTRPGPAQARRVAAVARTARRAAAVARACRRPGARVRLCVSSAVDVPVAVGLFDGMVVLPQHVAETFDAPRRRPFRPARARAPRAARRLDGGRAAGRPGAAVLQPGRHLIARRLDLEREIACDDRVVAATPGRPLVCRRADAHGGVDRVAAPRHRRTGHLRVAQAAVATGRGAAHAPPRSAGRFGLAPAALRWLHRSASPRRRAPARRGARRRRPTARSTAGAPSVRYRCGRADERRAELPNRGGVVMHGDEAAIRDACARSASRTPNRCCAR